MSVAQKLCEDIVGPIVKGSSSSCTELDGSSSQTASNTQSSRTDKPATKKNTTTRANVIKQKELNKTIGPYLTQKFGGKRVIVINKLNSKEVLVKRAFLDTANNTTLSGPLKCTDTDCVTNVRRRNNLCKCSILKRQCLRVSSKQIQTGTGFHLDQTDKACAYRVETTSCGTQFVDELLDGECNAKLKPPLICNDKQTMISQVSLKPVKQACPVKEHHSRGTRMRSTAPNRWSIRHTIYPSHGPDF